MRVQISGDKQAIRIVTRDMADTGGCVELNIEQAVNLARDLIDAVTQCGHEVKMNVQVETPKFAPTQQQMTRALARLSLQRKHYDGVAAWNDPKANLDILENVLKELV